MSTQKERVSALLEIYGRTFAAELDADIQRNTPAPLFQLLYLALLTSAPVQAVWTEFHPFAEQASLKAADHLGLPTRAEELARLAEQHDFPRLVAALVRTQLGQDFDRLLQAAE